jgi:hypothetical protein
MDELHHSEQPVLGRISSFVAANENHFLVNAEKFCVLQLKTYALLFEEGKARSFHISSHSL